MDEIRVGIIGFGFMGKAHTYGYKTIPLYYSGLPFKIKLMGVCNRTLSVAERAVEELGFEFATSNQDDILLNKEIDVINICTPNIHHKDAVLKAIGSGKHVYCDKPLAVSYEEAREIIGILEKHDVITQMALQYRFYPATMRARNLLKKAGLENYVL